MQRTLKFLISNYFIVIYSHVFVRVWGHTAFTSQDIVVFFKKRRKKNHLVDWDGS